MPLYDLRCSDCGAETERASSYAEAENVNCVCGGTVKIIITQVNLSSDCMPTRGYGRTSGGPTLLRPDGSQVNPGHEKITSDMLRLNRDQVYRLGLK
jgi:putative FmdB family regulatory protein